MVNKISKIEFNRSYHISLLVSVLRYTPIHASLNFSERYCCSDSHESSLHLKVIVPAASLSISDKVCESNKHHII